MNFVSTQFLLAPVLQATIYNGDGVGFPQAGEVITGSSNPDFTFTQLINYFVTNILAFVGLAAVTILIIAGIMLIVSGGDDTLKGRAQKMITYTIIGLLVILAASALVRFVTSLL